MLEWDSVQRKFPWGVILLMGGGFALARGAQSSCLSSIAGALRVNSVKSLGQSSRCEAVTSRISAPGCDFGSGLYCDLCGLSGES